MGKKQTLRALPKNPTTTGVWSLSASNEFGCLMNGNQHCVVGTQTMEMIWPSDILQEQVITYASTVCDDFPHKQETHRYCLVVGGDKLPYASDSAVLAANLIESMILFNSIVSILGAKFMTIDIKLLQLLDYVATHPNAVIWYHKSDMVLHVKSDTAHLVLPEARSRLAGHYFLSTDPSLIRTVIPNCHILTECCTIKHMMASSTEAKTSGLFHDAQTALPIWYLL